MGFFDGIEDAKTTEGGVYLTPGVYEVEVQKCKVGTTRKARPFFVADLKILQSNNPDRPIGSHASWMVMLDRDSSMGNIKEFIAAAEKVDAKEVDKKAAELAVSDGNPLSGAKLRAEAHNIKTRAGGDFTKIVWHAA